MKRDFDAAAKTWDMNEARNRMSMALADAMVEALELTGTETLLDYGTGTGAIALRMQPLVRHVIAVDSSRGMLDVLENKIRVSQIANVTTAHFDLEHESSPPDGMQPEVIVSAMALHHIADTARFARALARMLPADGRIGIADLDTEQGDFHADNTGVAHFGFDRGKLERLFADCGFCDIQLRTAYEMNRLTPSGQKTFTIFLLTARRA